jgi:hypothetical protein
MPTDAAGELIPEAVPAHSGDAMPTRAFSAIMEATAPRLNGPVWGRDSTIRLAIPSRGATLSWNARQPLCPAVGGGHASLRFGEELAVVLAQCGDGGMVQAVPVGGVGERWIGADAAVGIAAAKIGGVGEAAAGRCERR